jgi:hypothetical protein
MQGLAACPDEADGTLPTRVSHPSGGSQTTCPVGRSEAPSFPGRFQSLLGGDPLLIADSTVECTPANLVLRLALPPQSRRSTGDSRRCGRLPGRDDCEKSDFGQTSRHQRSRSRRSSAGPIDSLPHPNPFSRQVRSPTAVVPQSRWRHGGRTTTSGTVTPADRPEPPGAHLTGSFPGGQCQRDRSISHPSLMTCLLVCVSPSLCHMDLQINGRVPAVVPLPPLTCPTRPASARKRPGGFDRKRVQPTTSPPSRSPGASTTWRRTSRLSNAASVVPARGQRLSSACASIVFPW